VLNNIGLMDSLTLWETWDDYDESVLVFWPNIVGIFNKKETAIVIELCNSKDGHKGTIGAKVCTEKNIVGWVNVNYLKKIT